VIRVSVLGATGSIGAAARDIARAHHDRIRVVSLAARRNDAGLLKAARALGARKIALSETEAAGRARARFDGEVLEGEAGLLALASDPEADIVINALVGSAGLGPTIAALECGKRVALANKESVVMAGELLVSIAMRTGGSIVPVDSEHSGLFQCLAGREPDHVRRITITASGGPFLRRNPADVHDATPEEVLRHPTWSMGERITVDSATLVNKGFEVIEARWLFGLAPDRVEVVIHPQSIVHALVEFVDGSVVAQLSVPDMRLPLLYAITHPERWDAGLPRLELAAMGALHFEAPDPARCPGLALAQRALAMGGTTPAALNAADEEAVRLFLAGSLRFGEISPLLSEVLEEHRPVTPITREAVMEADRWARERLLSRAAPRARR
jgi:1-deoxy-D-xylulose-5-phosphate reductoisomerase